MLLKSFLNDLFFNMDDFFSDFYYITQSTEILVTYSSVFCAVIDVQQRYLLAIIFF